MHAKMTRDRKKCFIASVEKTIDMLMTDNQRMRDALVKITEKNNGGHAVTPNTSPLIGSISAPTLLPSITPEASGPVSHGFSLSIP